MLYYYDYAQLRGFAEMNDAEKYLLRVLRGFVQGEDPGPFSGDWQQLYTLSMMHSVTGILGHSVMSYPHEDSAPIAQMMRRQCLQTMALFSQRGEAMAKLTEALSNEGIDHLLFKGYVVRDYYTIPELRTFGDIDFLIHPEDRKKCDALMKQWGFEPKEDWEPVFSYIRGAEFYEIHSHVLETDISERADYREYFSHIWDYAIQQSEHTYVLKPEYHLLYLLTHIAKHIHSSGAGVRMYLDIAFFLKHFGDNLDWTWFLGELEKLNFYDFTNMVFTFVKREFGVESPIPLRPADEQTYQDFVDFTMAGGTFGKFGRDSAVIQLKNQDIGEENVSKGKTLLHRVFPSVSTIDRRYTYLQKHPWLLPVAWVHRLIKNKDHLGHRVQEMQNIVNADAQEVLKYKRIYQEIGL